MFVYPILPPHYLKYVFYNWKNELELYLDVAETSLVMVMPAKLKKAMLITVRA